MSKHNKYPMVHEVRPHVGTKECRACDRFATAVACVEVEFGKEEEFFVCAKHASMIRDPNSFGLFLVHVGSKHNFTAAMRLMRGLRGGDGHVR